MKAVVVCALCLLAVFVAVQPAEIFTRMEQWNPISCEKAKDLKEISSEIWKADSNRLLDQDLHYNNEKNLEPGRLFTEVEKTVEDKLNEGTYGHLRKLLDCYNTQLSNYLKKKGQAVHEEECRTFEDAFLDSIIATEPIKCLRKWLGTHPGREMKELALLDNEFKGKLNKSWFHQFDRQYYQPPKSSGFKHTFVGEISKKKNKPAVMGFHNWVQAYFEEQAGRFQYNKYKSNCQPAIESFSFDWTFSGKENSRDSYQKQESTMFMRTSPEVEIALYTLCFLKGPTPDCTSNSKKCCDVSLDGFDVKIVVCDETIVDETGTNNTISTAFPSCPKQPMTTNETI